MPAIYLFFFLLSQSVVENYLFTWNIVDNFLTLLRRLFKNLCRLEGMPHFECNKQISNVRGNATHKKRKNIQNTTEC